MKWMAFWLSHSPLLIYAFSFLDSLNPFSSPLLHQFLSLTPQKKFSSHTSLFKIRALGTASEKLEFRIWISLWQKQRENICGRLEPWEKIQWNNSYSPRIIYRHTTAQWRTDSNTGKDLLWYLHQSQNSGRRAAGPQEGLSLVDSSMHLQKWRQPSGFRWLSFLHCKCFWHFPSPSFMFTCFWETCSTVGFWSDWRRMKAPRGPNPHSWQSLLFPQQLFYFIFALGFNYSRPWLKWRSLLPFASKSVWLVGWATWLTLNPGPCRDTCGIFFQVWVCTMPLKIPI